MFLLRFCALLIAGGAAFGQGGYTLTVNPGVVSAGGQSFTLVVSLLATSTFSSNPTPQSTWVVRWNGSPRPTVLTPNGNGQLAATIPSTDIGQPGFAEITVLDQATGIVYPAFASVLVAVDVNVSDWAYDSVRNRFYVTVPTGGSRPNAPAESVVTIDASTGAILNAVNVGPKPTLLAISDDCSYLYVSVSGGTEISRISLASFLLDLQIPIGTGEVVSWMQVMPGSPKTIAASETSTGTNPGGLFVYDNAISRAPGLSVNYQRFVFVDAATIVAGAAGFPMRIWKISATGLTPGDQLANNTTQDLPYAYADGWILGESSRLYDFAGVRPSVQPDISGTGAIVPGKSRLLVLGNGSPSNSSSLGAFDESTITDFGRLALQGVTSLIIGTSSRLLTWGADGVAFVVNQQLFFGHTELAAASPTASAAGTVNAATLRTGGVAPGEILSIFGSNLGLAAGRSLEFSSLRQVSSDLGQTQVWFDGFPGTMLYTSSGQINVVAPFEIAGKTSTRVQVWYQGIPSAFLPLPVTTAAPGIFTQNGSGTGPASILNADYTLNTASQAAPAGSAVSVYATGGGLTSPASSDGQQDVYANPLSANLQVFLNGTAVPVLYAGSAPGLVAGVVQVNFQIPSNFPPSSAVTLQLSAGGITSPAGVTMSVR